MNKKINLCFIVLFFTSLLRIPTYADQPESFHITPLYGAQPERVLSVRELPFEDLESHHHINAIASVYEQGVMMGDDQSLWDPDSFLRRSEAAQIQARLLDKGYEGVGYNCFKDINGQEWYADAVCGLKDDGFLTGYPDGSFKPLKPVSGAEAIAMLFRITDLVLDLSEPLEGVSWYEPYADQMLRMYMWEGYHTTESYLNMWVSRNEFAEIIRRVQLWQKIHQDRQDDFLVARELLGSEKGSLKDRFADYVQPWEVGTYGEENEYLGTVVERGEILDANGKELPLGLNEVEPNRFRNWVTFPYIDGKTFSVHLITGDYRFDQLPAHFPTALFDGYRYLIPLNKTYCMGEIGFMTSDFSCGMAVYNPNTEAFNVFHYSEFNGVIPLHGFYEDDWGNKMAGASLMLTSKDSILLSNDYYYPYCVGYCFSNRYYYKISENKPILTSELSFKTDSESDEMIFLIDMYPKDETPIHIELETGIFPVKPKFEKAGTWDAQQKTSEGFISEVSSSEIIEEIYKDFYINHPEYHSLLHPLAANFIESHSHHKGRYYDNYKEFQEKGCSGGYGYQLFSFCSDPSLEN